MKVSFANTYKSSFNTSGNMNSLSSLRNSNLSSLIGKYSNSNIITDEENSVSGTLQSKLNKIFTNNRFRLSSVEKRISVLIKEKSEDEENSSNRSKSVDSNSSDNSLYEIKKWINTDKYILHKKKSSSGNSGNNNNDINIESNYNKRHTEILKSYDIKKVLKLNTTNNITRLEDNDLVIKEEENESEPSSSEEFKKKYNNLKNAKIKNKLRRITKNDLVSGLSGQIFNKILNEIYPNSYQYKANVDESKLLDINIARSKNFTQDQIFSDYIDFNTLDNEDENEENSDMNNTYNNLYLDTAINNIYNCSTTMKCKEFSEKYYTYKEENDKDKNIYDENKHKIEFNDDTIFEMNKIKNNNEINKCNNEIVNPSNLENANYIKINKSVSENFNNETSFNKSLLPNLNEDKDNIKKEHAKTEDDFSISSINDNSKSNPTNKISSRLSNLFNNTDKQFHLKVIIKEKNKDKDFQFDKKSLITNTGYNHSLSNNLNNLTNSKSNQIEEKICTNNYTSNKFPNKSIKFDKLEKSVTEKILEKELNMTLITPENKTNINNLNEINFECDYKPPNSSELKRKKLENYSTNNSQNNNNNLNNFSLNNDKTDKQHHSSSMSIYNLENNRASIKTANTKKEFKTNFQNKKFMSKKNYNTSTSSNLSYHNKINLSYMSANSSSSQQINAKDNKYYKEIDFHSKDFKKQSSNNLKTNEDKKNLNPNLYENIYDSFVSNKDDKENISMKENNENYNLKSKEQDKLKKSSKLDSSPKNSNNETEDDNFIKSHYQSNNSDKKKCKSPNKDSNNINKEIKISPKNKENMNKRNSKLEKKPTSKEIMIIDILTLKDMRTTVMIRHIPNKYTLDDLVYEIDELFYGKYTYINLPLDFSVRFYIYFDKNILILLYNF
jgi:hypothetical protein